MNLRTGPHLWNLLKVWWKQWCWCATCSDIEWEDGGGVVWKCGVKQFFWLSQRRIGQKVIPSNRCQKDRTISGLTINGIRHVLCALKCALSEDVWSVVFNREGVPVKLVIFPSCRRLGLLVTLVIGWVGVNLQASTTKGSTDIVSLLGWWACGHFGWCRTP